MDEYRQRELTLLGVDTKSHSRIDSRRNKEAPVLMC